MEKCEIWGYFGGVTECSSDVTLPHRVGGSRHFEETYSVCLEPLNLWWSVTSQKGWVCIRWSLCSSMHSRVLQADPLCQAP